MFSPTHHPSSGTLNSLDTNGGNDSSQRNEAVPNEGSTPNERSRLLEKNGATPGNRHDDDVEQALEKDDSQQKKIYQNQKPPTATEFYFDHERNPSIQRYYRFRSTPLTPVAALYKRPGTSTATNTTNAAPSAGGVTGLLRRSAVVPSHGMDSSGEWVLVSVGGRSGWANRGRIFEPATQFTAAEAWMGNHAFFLRGKLMLGSDAPSLFLTNGLIIAGCLIHFLDSLPSLRSAVADGLLPAGMFLLSNSRAMLIVSAVSVVFSLIFLWSAAVKDPGIIPSVSSPTKALPPVNENGQVLQLGGSTGYRYCSTCNIFRPPRSKHCNSCNVCVSVFDHHCPVSCSFLLDLSYHC